MEGKGKEDERSGVEGRRGKEGREGTRRVGGVEGKGEDERGGERG